MKKKDPVLSISAKKTPVIKKYTLTSFLVLRDATA
jgi:hypothetical protein